MLPFPPPQPPPPAAELVYDNVFGRTELKKGKKGQKKSKKKTRERERGREKEKKHEAGGFFILQNEVGDYHDRRPQYSHRKKLQPKHKTSNTYTDRHEEKPKRSAQPQSQKTCPRVNRAVSTTTSIQQATTNPKKNCDGIENCSQTPHIAWLVSEALAALPPQ